MERKGARISRNGFKRITEDLKGQIETGEIAFGVYLPTEKQLQESFGASRATIRKALAALVDAGWGKSVPNKGVMATRGFRPSSSNTIALIEQGSYVLQILGVHLGDLLKEGGFRLSKLGGSNEYPMEYAFQRALDNDFAGAIVWPYNGFPDLEIIQRACKQIPVVTLEHRIEGVDTDVVTFDHEAAAYLATEHLIKQGCRRIGVTGMFDMLGVTHQRFRGYMKAMFANGLQPLPRDYVFTATSGHDFVDSHSLERFLRAGDRPDGFLVLQDLYLPQTVECALRVGLSVPHDIKFVAIGDDLEVTVDGVGMTAVAFDWSALTQQAFHLLTERLDNLHRPPQVRLASHQLVVRGLCGAPKDQWSNQESTGQIPIPKSQFHYSTRWSVPVESAQLASRPRKS